MDPWAMQGTSLLVRLDRYVLMYSGKTVHHCAFLLPQRAIMNVFHGGRGGGDLTSPFRSRIAHTIRKAAARVFADLKSQAAGGLVVSL
jgi:hypothetical protein